MTGIFVNGSKKHQISSDEFDMLLELIQAEDAYVKQRLENSGGNTSSEEMPDNYKPDWKTEPKKYYQKYYKENLKQPYTCEDCGRIISSKSNLSKHKKSNVCKRRREVSP